MVDPKKIEELTRRIQDLNRQVMNHTSTADRIKREKESHVRDYDNKIKREEDEITKLNRQMDDLKRQLR